MAYRDDKDLEFLKNVKNDDLETLVTILTRGKSTDSLRITEELSSKIGSKPYTSCIEDICEEIQRYGGNTIANIFRGGKGVLYKEILIDVASKMKVNFNKDSSVATIENHLISKVFTETLEKMTDEDRKSVLDDIGIKTDTGMFTATAVTAAIQIAIRNSGFAPYKMAVIIANALSKAIIGRGLAFGTGATLTKSISIFAGPIGWAITGLWTAFDIASPAYRVTIPTVVEIACLRAIYSKQN